ncbi:MAG: hypothetical protein UZ22_OP11002000213 [Microgenomates bacterium OLB23]|nr:MAG: hypothetical protein UZ22_OP11002000213 [Microgenomates bacterium OLB23]
MKKVFMVPFPNRAGYSYWLDNGDDESPTWLGTTTAPLLQSEDVVIGLTEEAYAELESRLS